MASTKWIVGAKAWLVPGGGSAPCEVTIAKVGRKYVTLKEKHLRFNEYNIETGREKSDWTDSRLYVAHAEWDAIVTRRKAWDDLRRAVHPYIAPEGLSTETILAALKLLKEK